MDATFIFWFLSSAITTTDVHKLMSTEQNESKLPHCNHLPWKWMFIDKREQLVWSNVSDSNRQKDPVHMRGLSRSTPCEA
mmetsp:Transcript_26045/g.53892  ORF Transcript_26045/g.53892 Transcript_26045/m.53892 type:complete len:80 (+) Transcript_26045:1-240(+)